MKQVRALTGLALALVMTGSMTFGQTATVAGGNRGGTNTGAIGSTGGQWVNNENGTAQDITTQQHKVVRVTDSEGTRFEAVPSKYLTSFRKKLIVKYNKEAKEYMDEYKAFRKDKENKGQKFDLPRPRMPQVQPVSRGLDYESCKLLAERYTDQQREKEEAAEKKAEERKARLEAAKAKREEAQRILREKREAAKQ
jgi:hypothetical protein